MKTVFGLLAGLALTLPLSAYGADVAAPEAAKTPEVPAAAAENSPLKTQKDKVSYAIGLDVGGTFKRMGIEFTPEILLKGIQDAASDAKPLMTQKEIQDTMMAFQQEMMSKAQAHAMELGEKNKKEGAAFLAENKKKAGVATLPSGLQYEVLKEGAGPTPKETDMVSVNYTGTLIDNQPFTTPEGQPAVLPVGGSMLKGWTEALQLMKVGSKWRICVPADLAYGEAGRGPVIGPNATLIFEIELVGIHEPEKPVEKPAAK